MTWSATGTLRTISCRLTISSAVSVGVSLRRHVGRGPLDDLELFLLVGIVDVDVEHEAVELRLGQRVGAFLLDRVLRGQHEERLGQPVPLCRRR